METSSAVERERRGDNPEIFTYAYKIFYITD